MVSETSPQPRSSGMVLEYQQWHHRIRSSLPSSFAGRPLKSSMATKLPAVTVGRTRLSSTLVSLPYTVRTYSHFPPARRRYLFQRSRDICLPVGRRTFASTPWRRFADVDDTFDPRQLDRESDQVDVCIVGGGTSFSTVLSWSTLTLLQDLPGSAPLYD